ncbi:MAG: hypothetical protein AAGG11_23380 [Pseudomonadota bacterium]
MPSAPLPAAPDPTPPAVRIRWQSSLLFVLGAALLLALAWQGSLDRYAETRAEDLLTRALTTYTLARTLNGAISVAQGTEIAVQPVGVGVTITAGEILDPLNDLIERFSWLVLIATASLGTQLMLTQIFASPLLNGALSAIVLIGLLAHCWPKCPGRELLRRLALMALLGRFLIALVTVTAALANAAFLADRESAALAELESVSATVAERNEEVIEEAASDAEREDGILDRIGGYFGRQADALNVQQRLDALRTNAERAVVEVINLIVIFVLQTILFPLAALWLGVRGFRALLPWLLSARGSARG